MPKKNQWQALASLKLKDEFPASSRGWQVTRCWRTEETTEMKQQSESSWPGVYRGALASAFFFLCWLQTFLGREQEVFKAQTLGKLAPCWEHASLPSPTADAATVHCPLFPFPSPHAGNTRNEKSSPSYQSRTQYTSKTRRENTIPPSFGWTNREISAQFVQSLLLLILCKQSQLAGTCSLARSSPPECVNFVLNASVQFLIHTCAVYLFLRNK